LGTTVVVGLLLVLATLQYRWLGQISEADQARLHASAQGRAEEFARDFDREITRAYLRLRFDAAALHTLDPGAFQERLSRWRAVAAHPGLVKEAWLAGPKGKELWRLDSETATLVPSPWPDFLARVRAHIEERAAAGPRPGPGLGPGEAAAPSSPRPIRPGGFDFVDEAAFALVSPIPGLEREREGPGRGGPMGFASRFVGYTILGLDGDCIREQLLPALARRHFGLDDDAEYAVLVTARDDPGTVIFRSSPKNASPGPGDASARLFGVRFEDATSDDFAAFPSPGPGPPSRERPEIRAFPGRRGPGPRGEHEGRWDLVATHRAGSVDHVVAAARLRNLGVSAFILVLLGVSVALVAVSAQRARLLAERQVEFVAGVSHELRTPVAVIASAAENLADGVVSEREMVRRYGRVVRDEARRLAEMVEQVLDFAGSHAGRRAYRFEAVDVAEVARSCVEAARPALDASAATVAAEIEPDLPAVRADPAALRRALLNLLQNAIKYGGDAPRVRLRSSSVRHGGKTEVRLAVEDQGIGISLPEQKRLFEPFFRGEEARARQIRGSGLGLSLVKRIVEAHAGRIIVESTPGRGSTFTIALPALSGAAAALEAVEETHGSPHTAR
jgi:signal transduction histidine kinase